MYIWMPPTEAPDSRPPPDKEPENPPSAVPRRAAAPDVIALPDSVPLRDIRDFAGMPLQLKMSMLRCGEEILGLWRYRSGGLWGEPPQARGGTTRGTWALRGYGMEVEVETERGERWVVRPYGPPRFSISPYARYHNPTLSLPNGHDYFLASGGFWTAYYRWFAADDTALVTFSVRPHGFMPIRYEVEMAVHPPAAALPELDLLITLGLYLAFVPAEPP